MGQLARAKGIDLAYNNIDKIWKLYEASANILREIAIQEQESLIGKKEKYSHGVFFKSSKPKKFFEDYLTSKHSTNILN
jgi:hypothetical protein